MPDAVASYSADGQTYYVTADEGDDRDDFFTPDESTTVSNAAYDLDDAVFPNDGDAEERSRRAGAPCRGESLGDRG